jgi:primosomal protein N'
MYYYQILLTKNLPNPILFYCSELLLSKGQLVSCPVRKSEVFGIIIDITYDIDIVSKIDFEVSKIQPIKKIFNYFLPLPCIQLTKIFASSTFNNTGIILQHQLQIVSSLGIRDFIKLIPEVSTQDQQNAIIKSTQSPNISVKPSFEVLGNYELDIALSMRIMYLIRTHIYTPNFVYRNLLIIFPEKKMLNRILDELEQDYEYQKLLNNPEIQINIFQYSGEKTRDSKQTIRYILNSNKEVLQKPCLNIIFGTRSSIFLPFTDLDEIILLDEASPYYQQDQMSLYYDTREVTFWLQKVYHCNLKFLSYFPSSRLHNLHNSRLLSSDMSNISKSTHKPPKIKITHYDRRFTKNSLFSPQIEALLDDEIGVLGE